MNGLYLTLRLFYFHVTGPCMQYTVHASRSHACPCLYLCSRENISVYRVLSTSGNKFSHFSLKEGSAATAFSNFGMNKRSPALGASSQCDIYVKARVYLKEISKLMYSGSSIYKFIFWSNLLGSNKPRDAGTLNWSQTLSRG
jgi:hypothetical protein